MPFFHLFSAPINRILLIYTIIAQDFMRFCLFFVFLECCNDSTNQSIDEKNSYSTTDSHEVGYNAHSLNAFVSRSHSIPFKLHSLNISNLTWSCAVCVAHWVRVVTNAKKIHKKSIFLQWLGAVESEKHTFPRHQLFALIFAPHG